jgi:hypothetical protein
MFAAFPGLTYCNDITFPEIYHENVSLGLRPRSSSRILDAWLVEIEIQVGELKIVELMKGRGDSVSEFYNSKTRKVHRIIHPK